MHKPTTLATVTGLALAAGLSLAACGSSSAPTVGQSAPAAPAASSPASSSAPAPAPAPAAVPVLSPGHSVTFTIRANAGEPATSLTWTMGPRIVTMADATKPGYQSAGFQVTIRNNGPAPTAGSPDYGTSLVWTGTDGRSDSTLASEAAEARPDQLGLTGTEIQIQPSLPAGGYVSGYLIWEIPTAPGYATLSSSSAQEGDMTEHPVMRVNLSQP